MKKAFKVMPPLIWGLIILVLSAIKIPEVQLAEVGNWFQIDKLGHVIMYSILSFLMGVSFRAQEPKVVFPGFLMWTFLLSSFYGLCMEIMQFLFFKDRYFEVLDLIANIIGSFCGVFLIYFLKDRIKWMFH